MKKFYYLYKTTSLLITFLFIAFTAFCQEIEKKPILGKSKATRDSSVVIQKDSLRTPIIQKAKEASKDSKETELKQVDTSIDTTVDKSLKNKKIFDPDSKNAPLKAALFAIVPGGGQAFNRKYWKIPIVYAGMGVAGYFVVRNTTEHQVYKFAYQYRVDSLDSTSDVFPLIDAEGIKIQRDIQRRNLELAYIGLVAVFVLSGIDSFVDSHLRTFDISDDLSMRIEPKFFLQREIMKPGVGIGLTFSLE